MRRFAITLVLLLAAAGCLDLVTIDPTRNLSGPEALVWSQPSHLVVELDYVDGRMPTDYSQQRLREVLMEETNKETLEFRPPTRIQVGDSSAERVWQLAEILDLHREVFAAAEPLQTHDRDNAYLHVLFLNGRMQSGNDTFAAGVHIANMAVVFPDTVREAINLGLPIPLPIGPTNPSFDQAEASILVHELGHALGLVDRGAPMTTDRLPPEEDDPCQCHSNDPDSVMFPIVERFNPVRFIMDGHFVRDQFTAQDRADLAALRDLDPFLD